MWPVMAVGAVATYAAGLVFFALASAVFIAVLVGISAAVHVLSGG